MSQKTIKHCFTLQPIFESSVKVRLLYAAHSYMLIMKWELPKECLNKHKTSSATQTYSALSKVILFMVGHKNKNPQKVDILHDAKVKIALQLYFYFFCY